jgi:hypothetical protein
MDYKEIVSDGVNWFKIFAAGLDVFGATTNTAISVRFS